MTEAPDSLEVRWSATGAELSMFPLRRNPSLMDAAGSFAWTVTVLWTVAMVPLFLVQLFNRFDELIPVLAFLSCLTLGLVFELLQSIRRRWSELLLRIEPERVELEHRIFGVHIVTTEVSLVALRRIEIDERGSLIFRYVDGRNVVEPLPAIPETARSWLLALLLEARETSGDFWRDQLKQSAGRRAVQAISEVSQTR